MKCLNCNEEFIPLSVNQLYCCTKCGVKYRKSHDTSYLYPSIEFNCTMCGKKVVTEEGLKDKRTRFCSNECEKKYWKHPFYEHESNNTNFHNINHYISWEKRTNN